jgi:DNA-binding NarL/FixJ family response regulator
MSAIRTVLVSLSPIMSDVIAALLLPQITLDIVARYEDRTEAKAQICAAGPALILIGLHKGEPDDLAAQFLARAPGAKVIAFSSDARSAYVHVMCPHRTLLADVSPCRLLAALLTLGSSSSS